MPIASSHQNIRDVILKDIVTWRHSETFQLYIVAQAFGKIYINDVVLPPTFR